MLIDADPAMLVRGGFDIDDDLAILFALGSPELEVRGLTVTYGNTSIGRAFRDACRLLDLTGRKDIPVVRGAGWLSRDMTRETDASRFIVDQVRRSDSKPLVVTLGPLTNLAAALRSAPDIADRIGGHLALGGRLASDRFEFNFFAHPEAVNFVLSTPVPRVVVPIDVCMSVTFKQREIDRIRERTGSVAAFLCPWIEGFVRTKKLLNPLLSMKKRSLEPPEGFHPWDIVAMAYLVKPEIFTDIQRLRMWMKGARVMTAPANTGETPAPARTEKEKEGTGDWAENAGGEVTVPARVDAAAMTETALERICAVRKAR